MTLYRTSSSYLSSPSGWGDHEKISAHTWAEVEQRDRHRVKNLGIYVNSKGYAYDLSASQIADLLAIGAEWGQ